MDLKATSSPFNENYDKNYIYQVIDDKPDPGFSRISFGASVAVLPHRVVETVTPIS